MTTVSELVDNGDIPEERKDNVKKSLHDLGYAASRAVGKAFLKITEKHMTDAGMSMLMPMLYWLKWSHFKVDWLKHLLRKVQAPQRRARQVPSAKCSW
ncbi:TPA: hypothetical protein ACH3X1_014999 [Trebouxia sp. C0004]